jgi:pglZ domain protein
MQQRILSVSGVLRMTRAIVIDQDGLWRRYECDAVASAKGFDVQHFTDDMKLRLYYETELQVDPQARRILVVDHAAFRVPYDIAKAIQIVTVSMESIFPMLDADTLRSLPSLDLDHLACIADMLPLARQSKQETLAYCTKGMYQGRFASAYGDAELNKAVELAHSAESHRDWTPVAKAFGKASMIHHGFCELKAFAGKQALIEDDFLAWLDQKYAKLYNTVDTKRPVLLSKVNDFMRKGNQKIALILMDGMSFENFFTIQRMLAQEPFLFDVESSFSFFPTVTSVARQSVFSGKLPMEHVKPFSLENEEKQWRDYWKEHGYRDQDIAFFKSETPDIPLQAKVVGIVINICDDLMHDELQGLTGLQQGIENWVRNKHLVQLLKTLLDRDFAVFMTADHGNTSAIAQGRFQKPGILAEPASRRAVIYQSYADAIELDKFPTSRYSGAYLPEGYTAYEFRECSCYGDKGKEYITHGGMTLEEALVPFIRIGEANG